MRRAMPFAVVLTGAIALSCSLAAAQDSKLDVKAGDSMKSLLERHASKRVTVVLTTGTELSGVVTIVGDQVVHLSELSGREFFDAVVGLDRINAVLVRVRGR